MKKKLLFLFFLLTGTFTLFLPVQATPLINTRSDSEFFQQDLSTAASALKVYPNPVKNYKFTVSANRDILSIKVNNILGQETEVDLVKKADRLYEVSMKERKQGIYLVTVIFGDQSKEVKRIVVNQE